MPRRRRPQEARGTLFVGQAERWWLNACLNWMPDSGPLRDAYASGYLQAAKYLTRAACRRRGRLVIDEVLYPIIFLWRHYLEIRLKEIILSASAILGDTRTEGGHHLPPLWKSARQLLERLGWTDDILREIDPMISDFDHHDPSSMAFRYTDANDANRAVTQINVYAFGRGMAQLSDRLEGISAELVALWQNEAALREQSRT